MPTAYIKKLHSEGKGPISHLESEWEKAKTIANKSGKGDNFAYITTIFKKMIGASIKNLDREIKSGVENHLEAKARLLATKAT